ncbi:unnamed protein product [Sphagnum balticum]
MAMNSHAHADMLLALITTNFPDPASSARGHKTFFCTSCNTGPHPLNLFVEEGKQHHGHNKLQVYRTSNRPSVLEEEIGNLLVDLQSIQRYSINQKTVVFITGPNSKIYRPNPKSNMIRNASCSSSSSSSQLPVSAHATPSCAKCTKLLYEATSDRFSSSSSIFCSLGCKFAEQLFNMQADRINAVPLAAVTGANVNTMQHSTKQSQEALADPNHTTSDGARSNAVGPTEEVCLHGQGLNACRSTGRSSKRRLQSGLNRRTILAPQRAPLS